MVTPSMPTFKVPLEKVTVICMVIGIVLAFLGAILCWAGISSYEKDTKMTVGDMAEYYALFIWSPLQNVLFGIVALGLVIARPIGTLSLTFAGKFGAAWRHATVALSNVY